MFVNLPLMSLSMSDIYGIDVVTVIYPVLRINFVKIHTAIDVVILITLLFGIMLSLMNLFNIES